MAILRIFNARRTTLLAGILTLFLWWTVQRHPDSFALQWTTSQPLPVFNATDIFDEPPADSHPFRDLCSKTEWNKDLILTCNGSGGGVGNLRNSILNCVRYAIAAGASMTLPKVILRNPANIADIWNRERTPFTYIFDQPHFVDSLALSCPQLQLYEDEHAIPNYNASTGVPSLSLLPEKLDTLNPKGLDHPLEWREYFYSWLANKTETHSPTIVNLERSYLQYPIYSDPPEFAHDFGKILKFRSDARILATTVLKKLIYKYELEVDIRQPIWLESKSFFGAHLRTEQDSRQGWPWQLYEYSRYETQSGLYLTQAAHSNTSIIYLASGSPQDSAQFSSDAMSRYNLTVTTKHDLLSEPESIDHKKALDAMTFDQQALVDFLVLLKSKDFAGVGHSSFAWNIALWRHMFALQRDHLNGPQLMSDELSQVYGTVGQYEEYAACLWP
jgi:hypothetical protein